MRNYPEYRAWKYLAMNHALQRWLAAAVLAALAQAISYAQESKPIFNWANVMALAAGSEVRVRVAGGRDLRGFVQRVTPDSLLLNATTSQETLARADVRRLSLKKPGHRGRNTLIGLGIGAGAGLAAGAGIDAQSNASDWFPYAGKAVFGPLGAILGTVIGVAWPTGGWRDIYRAP
ncbi:MAG: hypothetical protein J0H49_34710 [Acidobacteria bacterium]|nr:hypothetical protein [Acidobacteriota bacterium]